MKTLPALCFLQIAVLTGKAAHARTHIGQVQACQGQQGGIRRGGEYYPKQNLARRVLFDLPNAPRPPVDVGLRPHWKFLPPMVEGPATVEQLRSRVQRRNMHDLLAEGQGSFRAGGSRLALLPHAARPWSPRTTRQQLPSTITALPCSV